MDVNRILGEIDQEISRLQQIRIALAGVPGAEEKRKRGRPKGSGTKAAAAKGTGKKRQLSPEGRKAIADAMKRRWAERKKAQS